MIFTRLQVTTIPTETKSRSVCSLQEPISNDRHETLSQSKTGKPYIWHTHLRHWLPLIACSQRLENWHAIPVSKYVLDCIHRCQAAWQSRPCPISSETLEDIQNVWRSSELHQALAKVPTSGYFLRLDICSPKDTPGGLRAVHTLDDMITTLAQSARARQAIEEFLEEERLRSQRGDRSDDEREDDPFMIYLMPWNDMMDCAREFRVFVPPENGPKQRISAISQYRSHEPSIFLHTGELDIIANKVYDEAKTLLPAIVNHMWTSPRIKERDRQRLAHDVQRFGFVFDVTLTAEGEVLLLEINPFGALSGCGSCLFQWLRDAAQLNGSTDQVEFAFGIA